MFRKIWNSDKWLLTQQVEHARIAGLIAAAWDFGGKRPPEQVLLAISRHDEGWRPVDELPHINAAGAPRGFDEMGAQQSLEMWSRSSAALVEEGKHYAAGLVAAHVVFLARNYVNMAKLSIAQAVEMGKFIAQQQRLVERAKAEASGKIPSNIQLDDTMVIPSPSKDRHKTMPQNFEKDLRLLQVCDYLSVLLCTDFAGEVEIDNVPYLANGDRLQVSGQANRLWLSISPIPFRKNLRDHLFATIVPKKVYDSSEELQATIRGEKRLSLEFHLGNPEGKSTVLSTSR